MIEVNGLTGAEAFLRVLSGMGVERIFASPGSEWSPVWEALAKPDESMPVYLSSRHEEVALAMASGYAKSTGKLPGGHDPHHRWCAARLHGHARGAPRAGAHGGLHR